MRYVMAVLALALLVGCGDDSDAGGEATTTTSAPEMPEWLELYANDNNLEPAPEEGVWLDQSTRNVFVQDCERARDLTAEGGPYGPADGEPGWAYVCQG